MSELRTVKLSEMNAIKLGLRNDKLYFKAEADKMITEKDKNIDLYKRGWEESDRINAHLYAELRHSNYKRCLAMASLSLEKRETYRAEYEEWCLKWYKRWLELAEKFEHNSTAR